MELGMKFKAWATSQCRSDWGRREDHIVEHPWELVGTWADQ